MKAQLCKASDRRLGPEEHAIILLMMLMMISGGFIATVATAVVRCSNLESHPKTPKRKQSCQADLHGARRESLEHGSCGDRVARKRSSPH